jgi:Domain of unknown function (DUF5753)
VGHHRRNALYEDIGPLEVMREQIDFLIRAVTHHHIPMQILQRGNGALTGVGTSESCITRRVGVGCAT